MAERNPSKQKQGPELDELLSELQKKAERDMTKEEPIVHTDEEIHAVELSSQNAAKTAEAMLDKEQEALQFEGAKSQYEMLQGFYAQAEEKFQIAMANLQAAKPGRIRDLAMQEVLGAKQVTDNLMEQINGLEAKYDGLKETVQKEVEPELEPTPSKLDGMIQSINEKIGKVPDLAMQLNQKTQAGIDHITGQAKESVERWEDSLRNAVSKTKQDVKDMYASITGRAAAAMSVINKNMERAGEEFKARGAAAYIGVGVKAWDLMASFAEHSLKQEQKLLDKTTERLDRVNEIVDKVNNIKQSGTQFRNAWRNLFGLQEHAVHNAVEKDNVLSRYLERNIADRKEAIASLNQRIPVIKEAAKEARFQLVDALARIKEDKEQVQEIGEVIMLEYADMTPGQKEFLTGYKEELDRTEIELARSVSDVLKDSGERLGFCAEVGAFEEPSYDIRDYDVHVAGEIDARVMDRDVAGEMGAHVMDRDDEVR